ncbi:uncharacterized protein LOC134206613 [Armigeres subalbatus]|uniref:uncharacterized protein LOC134206613 n=1 Tax=Armigeres subalbatus TaxID=124917 RepID=UPI002ED654B3
MKHLKSYQIAYSVPTVIVTDRGTAFTSKQFASFVNDHGIRHQLVATACPQANGQIERYNRTLIPLLSKLVEERSQDWDTVLVEAEFLLNNSFNRSIGDVPSRLLFGIVQKRNVPEDLKAYVDVLNENFDRDLPALRDAASRNIRKLQEYNKNQYDMRSKVNTQYREGDLVSIRTVKQVGERSKLNPKFKGPYVVKKVLDRNRYVIADIDGYQVSNRKFEGIFDPSNMRLYQKNLGEEIPNFADSEDLEDVEYLEGTGSEGYVDEEYLDDE